MIIITYLENWGQTLKIETTILVLGMSGTKIDHVVFWATTLGTVFDFGQLGWPGESTQIEGEKLYPYDPVGIQGKKGSNNVYQNQA